MADVDQILNRLKNHKLVTIVVTVAAILAGIASFTDSLRTITEFVRDTFVNKPLNDRTSETLIIDIRKTEGTKDKPIPEARSYERTPIIIKKRRDGILEPNTSSEEVPNARHP